MSRRKCCCITTVDPPKPEPEKCNRANPYFIQSFSDDFEQDCLARDGLHGWFGDPIYERGGGCPSTNFFNQSGNGMTDNTGGFRTPYMKSTAAPLFPFTVEAELSILNSFNLKIPNGDGYVDLISANGSVELGYERMGILTDNLRNSPTTTTAPKFFFMNISLTTISIEILSTKRFIPGSSSQFLSPDSYYTTTIKINGATVAEGITSLDYYKNNMQLFSWSVEQKELATDSDRVVPFDFNISGGGFDYVGTLEQTLTPCLHNNTTTFGIGGSLNGIINNRFDQPQIVDQTRGVDLLDARNIAGGNPNKCYFAWPKADNFNFVID